MKLTGLDVFDNTIERTTEWLQDLMQELNWTDRRKSFVALRFVLQGLRDHLTADRASRFGNQLPMLIRGAYYEEWVPAEKPVAWESLDGLAASIATYLRRDDEWSGEAENIVRAVFRLLEKKATEGELQDHLLDFLPATRRAA